MTINHRYSLAIIVLLLLFVNHSFAQQDPNQKLASHYDSLLRVAPREKVYVQLDKNIYLAQDTIWFKGYLVEATSNYYSPVSALVYFDLIASDGQVMQTLALPTSFGLTWGSFALKEENYPSGTYTFRAYTKWMQNFGDTFIFKKEIKILGLSESPIVSSKDKAPSATIKDPNSAPIKINRDLDVQFLPESGSWIAGIYQKMAFKALNIQGKGTEISGEIIDSKQNVVTTFKSNKLGMGFFEMAPIADESYTAKIIAYNGEMTKSLPKPKASGTSIRLRLDETPDSLNITLTTISSTQSLTLIGQSKGVLCFMATVKPGTFRKVIKIAKNNFPTGVAQLIVMDEKKQVLNERNFFVSNVAPLNISSTSAKNQFNLRDSIPIKIKVTDQAGIPVIGSFSLAVTDDFQVAKDSVNDENILSYLLMSADLKGEIENPGYYFHDQNEQTKRDLDLLMLTQGWVSYDWDLKQKPTLKAETEYTISGRITNLTNKPSVAAKILLFGKNKSTMILDTLTNQNGEFVFDRLPPLDSASFVLQALNAKGKKGTLGFTVNEFQRPPFIPFTRKQLVLNEKPIDSISKQLVTSRNQAYETAIQSGIVLREVKITGKKIVKGSKNLNGPGEASQILTEENLAGLEKKTLLTLLEEKVNGFRTGNRRKSMVRDFFVNADFARFVIDGMELDFFYQPSGSPDDYYQFVKGYLDYYNAEDIKGVEVLSNGYSFSYKNQFKEPMDDTTYSFIEITTRSGSVPFLKKSSNMYLLKPINYGSNKVFYSPKYTSNTKTDKTLDLRSTLFWHPNVVTDKNGEANVSFFSSDRKGTYTVWIEGSDAKGGLGKATMTIKIK